MPGGDEGGLAEIEIARKALKSMLLKNRSREVRTVRRKFRIGATAAVCLATAAILISGARASFAHSGTADEQSACTPDVLSLCFWDIPSEDKIVACLNKNISRLSPECRKVIAGDDDDQKSKPSKK